MAKIRRGDEVVGLLDRVAGVLGIRAPVVVVPDQLGLVPQLRDKGVVGRIGVCLALGAVLFVSLAVVHLGDIGWLGVTPYLRFLALPHQQPPRVMASSMFWTNFATLFPFRADTQIGQPISQ